MSPCRALSLQLRQSSKRLPFLWAAVGKISLVWFELEGEIIFTLWCSLARSKSGPWAFRGRGCQGIDLRAQEGPHPGRARVLNGFGDKPVLGRRSGAVLGRERSGNLASEALP